MQNIPESGVCPYYYKNYGFDVVCCANCDYYQATPSDTLDVCMHMQGEVSGIAVL